MRRIGDTVFRFDGYSPRISLPEPLYGRLSKAQRFLDAVDKTLIIIGAGASLLGIPFGVPLLSAGIMLLLCLLIGRHVIVPAESVQLDLEHPSPTVMRPCPECGTDLGDTPDTCTVCGWQSDNPIDS